MPPALASALMSVSTIVVALNVQLLRRVDLRPPEIDEAAADAVRAHANRPVLERYEETGRLVRVATTSEAADAARRVTRAVVRRQ